MRTPTTGRLVAALVLLALAAAAGSVASARSALELSPAYSLLEGAPEARQEGPPAPAEELGHTGLSAREPADTAG